MLLVCQSSTERWIAGDSPYRGRGKTALLPSNWHPGARLWTI